MAKEKIIPYANGAIIYEGEVRGDDGSYMECAFVNGKAEGKSVTRYADGSTVIDYYKNDVKIG